MNKKMKQVKFILGIVLLWVFFPLSSPAQNSQIDSLKASIQYLDREVNSIKLNLRESNKQYKTGLWIWITGMGVMAAGCFVEGKPDSEGGTSYELKNFVLASGFTMSLVGGIFMLDSHKYIGRAGR